MKKDGDFATFLGIKHNTLSTWIRRNTIDAALIVAKCPEVNGNWLLTGEGEMLIDNKKPDQDESGLAQEPQEQYGKAPPVSYVDELIQALKREADALREAAQAERKAADTAIQAIELAKEAKDAYRKMAEDATGYASAESLEVYAASVYGLREVSLTMLADLWTRQTGEVRSYEELLAKAHIVGQEYGKPKTTSIHERSDKKSTV